MLPQARLHNDVKHYLPGALPRVFGPLAIAISGIVPSPANEHDIRFPEFLTG